MFITDTHTHLYAEEFKPDLSELLKEAATLGVRRFFMPNIDRSSIDDMLALEKKYPGMCIPMMGLHPCYVKENWEEELATVVEWWTKRSFAAVGEIGIDLYWDQTFLEQQKIVFKKQVELANQKKVPIVIHTRDSFDVTIALLKETKKETPYGIFHCFTGTKEQAMEAIDMGFLLGIGGVVTYKNGGLDKFIHDIELKHIVLETDAPYLAPAPHRGKRNIPSYILKVAEKISELKKISVLEVATITTQNANHLFNT